MGTGTGQSFSPRGAAFRVAGGVEANDDTLALEVLREVGPGANSLGHDHTARHLRKGFWFPMVTNRETYPGWMAAGGKDLRQRANERARETLARHHPRHLSPEQEREVHRIAAAAQEWAITHPMLDYQQD